MAGPGNHPDGGHEPDIRFTLASERTFLAWIRTALAIVAAGVAAARLLGDAGPGGAPLAFGVALSLLGGFVAVAAYRRWQETDRAIRTGEPLPHSAMPITLTATVAVGALAAVALLLAAEI